MATAEDEEQRRLDRIAWREAREVPRLCELTAEFLRGERVLFPGWLADDVDEETDPIVPALCELCSAGVIPLASQPGHPRRREHDERLISRRAFLTALAPAGVTQGWEGRAAEHGWLVHSFPACSGMQEGPEGGVLHREAAALMGGEPFLWVGEPRGQEELGLFADHVAPDLLEKLGGLRYVTVLERRWGAGEGLFPALAASLDGPV